MLTHEINDMTQGYLDFLTWIRENGQTTAPRGQETIEIEDAIVTLTDPRVAMPAGVGRKLSLKILAAESMQWLGGFSDLTQLASASKGRFANFSDDGETLYGAYGPRAAYGLNRVVRVLAADPDSRQAVVSIWNNEETDVTKDLPCTLSWGFRIRDGKLNMSTTMRAWDAWTGVSYDLPGFTRIQSALAWALGVEVGTYTHHAHSLHIYTRDLEAIDRLQVGLDSTTQPPMLEDDLDTNLPDTDIITYDTPEDRWELIQTLAWAAYGGNTHVRLPPSFQWYADQLHPLARGEIVDSYGYVRRSKND